MLIALLAALALAEPSSVVAIGDSVVHRAPPPTAQEAPIAGGWVGVLADCLEERAPGDWAVIDRTDASAGLPGIERAVAAIKSPTPSVLVLGFSGGDVANAELDADGLRARVAELLVRVAAIEGATTLILGVLPPADGSDESAARAASWNGTLRALAAEGSGRRMVDLQAKWPASVGERGPLTRDVYRLTARGHALVASVVCDEIIPTAPNAEAPGGNP